ncbi:MAG: methyltransferase domain-containing protein [Polyangiaceae bacterium]|nr:methyltransferase domain-containing protein [Polyangiaceae bacterium]
MSPAPASGLRGGAADLEGRDRALFDRIAERYARKDLAPSSRWARRQRLLRTLEAIPPLHGAAILEVGCGAGFSAEYLRGAYSRFVGIDHSEGLVQHARERHGAPGVEFHAVSAARFEPHEPFDVVLLVGVLHHLEEPARAVAHMATWLRPGGFVVANEPHPGNPVVGWLRRARKRVDPAYSADQRELAEEELVRVYVEAGLEAVRVVPQGVLSTPFAEVVMPAQPVAAAVSRAACVGDTWLERALGPALRPLSWNLIVAGRAPGEPTREPAAAGPRR